MAYFQPYLNTPLPIVDHGTLPIPAMTGNTVNYNRIFTADDGQVYYVDHLGNALRIGSRAVRVLVPLGTDVTLGDLTLRPVTPQGFLLHSPNPGWTYNISAFRNYATNRVGASNLPNQTATATPTNPFSWTGFGPADMVYGLVTDVTNSRVYAFKLQFAVAPAQCFVEIERKL